MLLQGRLHRRPPHMARRTILLCVGVLVARGAGFESIYPYTHTNCGVTQVIQDTLVKLSA